MKGKVSIPGMVKPTTFMLDFFNVKYQMYGFY